ncbi:hypothetical protein ACYSNM_13030 [Myroides sp. LJL116]
MTDRTKIFNRLLLTIIIILVIMSMMALVTIHWKLSNKYSFSFSPDGINIYLTAFGQYKALFTATVATIAAYFGLLRLKVATDANIYKLQQDRFSDWKTVLDIRFIEIEKYDPYMKREFIRVRYKLFKQLYDFNFSISNKEQLTQVFQTNFKDLATFFETQNNKSVNMGGVYPNNKFSYSFDSFCFLLLGCVDNIYTDIVTDLENLYLATLPTNRTINNEMYKIAYKRNLKMK